MRVSLKAITLSSAVLWGGAMLFVGLIHMADPAYGGDFLHGVLGERYRRKQQVELCEKINTRSTVISVSRMHCEDLLLRAPAESFPLSK
jgi:hypothetical protein